MFETAKPAKRTSTKMSKESIIHTFCKELDDTLLYGGIYTTHLTYIAGEASSGKTNLCMQLLLQVQLPEICGGINGKSLYIYPTLFDPNRLQEMATLSLEELKKIISKLDRDSGLADYFRKITVESLLSNVLPKNIKDKDDLVYTVKHLHECINRHQIKLIVIEGVSILLQYFGSESREIFLRRLLAHLHELAYVNNVAVVITNSLDGKTYSGLTVDQILTEVCNVKLILQHKSESTFTAILQKTPFSFGRSGVKQDFKILRKGIRSINML